MTQKETFQAIHDLYSLVHEKTKPFHNEPKGFRKHFRPKLEALHHISPGDSKMEKNWLGIFVRAMYKFWEWCRNWYIRLARKIFPRKTISYTTRHDGTVTGTIQFAKVNDHYYSVHHIKVEMWGRNWIGAWKFMGSRYTDEEGKFSIPYDLFAINGLFLRKNLRLEIHPPIGVKYNKERPPQLMFDLFQVYTFPKSSLIGLEFNFGLIQLDYWEYQSDNSIPRAQIDDLQLDAPQHYENGRIDAISEQFIQVELISERLSAELANDPESVSTDEIQKAYPVNMTVGINLEDEALNLTRTDEYFGWRMMNGTYANIFDKVEGTTNEYWLHYHWSTYDHKTEEYIFPDTTCKFKLIKDGYLMPTEIKLVGALKKGEGRKTHIFTPQDGSQWQAAKRIARVQASLTAQVEKHFAGTHINIEQYALAVHRNIRRNPIFHILYPHLKGISLINHTADQILINEDGYITRTSPLTIKGLKDRLFDALGTYNWEGYTPVKPISDKHQYAKIANVYWDVLDQFVTEFIDLHKSGIEGEWYEIYRFSNDLFEHSVPKFLCRYLSMQFQSKTGGSSNVEEQALSVPDWYNRSGRMIIDKERLSSFGREKACSKVTTHPTKPNEGDMEKLKQLSKYIIFQATMGHFWSNFQQYDDIGELKYATLGLRYGTSPEGALGPESDDSILPPKDICIETMWWANMLSRTGYGFIMKNEDGDIHPRLIELLKEKEDIFAQYNFSIYDLQSRTNI